MLALVFRLYPLSGHFSISLLCGRSFCSLFYGKPCILPRIKSADQRMNVLESMLLQNERHTGARMLARSRTVNNDRVIAIDVGNVLLGLVRGYAKGTASLYIRVVPRLISTRIYDR